MNDRPDESRSRSGSSEHFRRLGETPSRRERSADERFKLLYDELRLRAASLLSQEKAGHTLQPTALVHEAYLKLAEQTRAEIKDDVHALAVAAMAMRRVLIDHARTRQRDKRGGGRPSVPFDPSLSIVGETPGFESVDLLALEEAMTEIETSNPRLARLIELRFYGGLTNPQIAVVLDVSLGTVENDWKLARELLATRLRG